jgi:DNA-binding IclR family transcriptional regulator
MSISNRETAPKRRGRPTSQAVRAAAEPEGNSEQRVEAVERALSILDAFTAERSALSLAELAARTGLYPSTILRLAGSLTRFGYLHRGADHLFRLGPTPLRIGLLYRQSFDLTDYVRPTLARLVDRTGETAAFYVREGDKRICLYRQHTPRLIRHHVEEGAGLPLDRGASARVLMAFTGEAGPLYDQVRANGVYVSIGERDPDTAAIAAPVFGRERRFLGALGITGLPSHFEGENLERLKATLVEEAELLSRSISGR